MRTHPAFKSLMNRSAIIRAPTLDDTEFRNLTLADLTAITGSPVSAAIQPMTSGARDDPFFPQYPEATHLMYCAAGITIKPGYLVTWTDAESATRHAEVQGPPEDEGGRGHHYRIALREVLLLPSGIS